MSQGERSLPERASALTVGDLDEAGLLQLIQNFCPPEIIGDDAAVCRVRDGHSLVVTADMLVDGVHFSDRTTSAYDTGWRAIAANLSDIAAMAATPLGVTISLGLPPKTPAAWVEALYRGAVDCLQVGGFNVPIVGGDLCSSPVGTVSISAFGEVEPELEMRRDSAAEGDAIVVTGAHGLSRLGLELLLSPDNEALRGIDPIIREQAIAAHQRPKPRLDLLPALQDYQAWTSVAGMDSSDGLADAIVQICRASGMGARLSEDALKSLMPPGLPEPLAWDWMLYGGEDFELVLCMHGEIACGISQCLGPEAAVIGEIVRSPEVVVVTREGQVVQTLDRDRGFQHFTRAESPPTHNPASCPAHPSG